MIDLIFSAASDNSITLQAREAHRQSCYRLQLQQAPLSLCYEPLFARVRIRLNHSLDCYGRAL